MYICAIKTNLMKIDLKQLATFEEQHPGAPATFTFITTTLMQYFLDNEMDSAETRPVFESLQELGIVSDIEEDFDEE